MTEHPLVSVIINCYNGEKYLREAIDSVLAQTYKNWEIVFWDNQSTDSPREIVESYSDPRIHYFYAPNHTPLGEARNLALEKVKGEYVCFLDADDIWEREFLISCVDILKRFDSVGLVYSRYTNFTKTENWLSKGFPHSGYVDLRGLIKGYNIGMSAAMFRLSILVRHTIQFDSKFSLIEDFDFFLKIAAQSSVYYIESSLMRYRHHEGNSSKSNLWPIEFDLMIEKVQKEYIYRPLVPYFQLLCNLRGYYVIMDLLDRGNRGKALKQVVRQCVKDISVLRYLFPIIFGKKSYLMLRNKIESRIYAKK